MNKELIKKYKKEFDHWLNGGEVLYFYWEDWYSSTCNPEMVFNHISPDDVKYYVINDEFVEFRKALAEGKTIQYNFGNHGINKKDFPNEWKDLDQSIRILADRACLEDYRIKPEEPKFKVGDWVVDIHSTTKARVLEVFGNQIRVKFCYPDAIITTDSSDFIHWVPKKGDWCWFWNETLKTPMLLQFERFCSTGLYKYDANNGRNYQYCEPFLGELPTNLKEPL